MGYADGLRSALTSVDAQSLTAAIDLISRTAAENNKILVAGNGGSAAIADHLCCDMSKGTHTAGHAPIITQSLSANGSLLTAISNDFGYAVSFAKQIEILGRPGDLLIAISSSGNSENIINAVRLAKQSGLKSIGLSGFSGGALNGLCDVSLHVDFYNYGVVEDAHEALMHVMAQVIVRRREGKMP
jgi:phosphoheptose isomerase